MPVPSRRLLLNLTVAMLSAAGVGWAGTNLSWVFWPLIVLLVLASVAVWREFNLMQGQSQELGNALEQLKQAKSDAEQSSQGKSAFLATMSHEIRTPFQGLLGMLSLLDATPLNQQQRDYLDTARTSAQHLLGIVNDVLDVSTMESGTLKLAVLPVSLKTLVRDVEALMRVAAEQKGLGFQSYVSSDLPAWVEADPTRLRQILFNLLNNAIKFTERGNVELELMPAGGLPPAVAMTIRDTGMGMDETTLQGLFSKFFQADTSIKRRFGGTGLGLEIARSLARMMGGDITVTSQLGVGTAFTVTLPLPEVPAPAPTWITQNQAEKRLRLLVAEDHPINIKYMQLLIEKLGHQAVFCENGQQAVEHLQQQNFDVVLMDMHMPVLDGLEATRVIRSLPLAAAQVRVILITADVVNDTRQQALAAGVDEFLSKPLQLEDLRQALGRAAAATESTPSEAVFPVSTYEAPLTSVMPIDGAIESIDQVMFRELLNMMPLDTLSELLQTYFDAEDGAVHRMLQAMAQPGERVPIGEAAHQLKGTSMLLGFRALAKLAGQLEYQALHTEQVLDASLEESLRLELVRTRRAAVMLGGLPASSTHMAKS